MRLRSAFLLPLALLLAACGSGDGTESPSDGAAATSAPAESTAPDDPLAGAPVLTPELTFALGETDTLNGIALSPDGMSLVAKYQAALGEPVTLRLYDVTTGEVLAETGVETLRIGLLHWMADNRLVASTTEPVGDSWRAWDGATLDELATVPLDLSCGEGQADKTTGAIYSASDDGLCRVDTSDGTTLRSPALGLVANDYVWVRAGANEVVAQLSGTGDDGSSVLAVLDATTWEQTSSTTVPFGTSVAAVGATTWLDDTTTGTAVLEPGAIPVPLIRDPMRVSSAGTVFVSANGGDDLVFISAVDGSVIGTLPAELNLSAYADWSIDDSSFVRVTQAGDAELYRF